MRPLLLVGAGGLAREVIASIRATGTYEVVGLLDDDADRRGAVLDGVPVVGAAVDAAARDEALLVCIGEGTVRERVVRRLLLAGVEPHRFARCIDRTVRVPQTCAVGDGSILLQGVTLTSDIGIGSHVVAMPGVVLTHDDEICHFATLAAGVLLGGGVRVGRAAYLGMGASVRQGLTVGDYATLGMGAVLVRDLPHRATWAGVPAQPLTRRSRLQASGESS